MHFLTKVDKVHLECERREYILQRFRESILEDIVPETNVEDNFQSFAITCAAVQSCREGRSILMTEFLS